MFAHFNWEESSFKGKGTLSLFSRDVVLVIISCLSWAYDEHGVQINIVRVGRREDMSQLDFTSSCPCKDKFSMLRENIRNFNVSQMMDSIEFTTRQMSLMFKHEFKCKIHAILRS